MVFVCVEYPQLRILLPDLTYAQFVGGKLELDPEDNGYETVLAQAEANPFISIHVNETTCDLCGEVQTGKLAKANLAKHIKDNHPNVWVAEQELAHARSMSKQLKHAEGYPCDVCAPVQTFGTKADLAEHVGLLHAQPPAMDSEGNEIAGSDDGGRRPGERAIPAATPTATA